MTSVRLNTDRAVYRSRNGRILGRVRGTSDWLDLCSQEFWATPGLRALVMDSFEGADQDRPMAHAA